MRKDIIKSLLLSSKLKGLLEATSVLDAKILSLSRRRVQNKCVKSLKPIFRTPHF